MSHETRAPAPIRHVIWDWNGTLLDDAHACVAALNRMLRRRGMAEIDHASYREVFDFPVRDYYCRLGFDFATEDWDANAREFIEYYSEACRDASLREGALAVLTRLHERGIPMSVLSAAETSLLRRMLEDHGVRGFFRAIYGLSDPYAHTKVARGRALMSELGLPPERVLLVGDTTHDYRVSREIGCRCVLISGGHQAEHRLRKCGCPVVSGLPRLEAVLNQMTGDSSRPRVPSAERRG